MILGAADNLRRVAVDDPILALVGKPEGPLADAALWSLCVSRVTSIAADYRRVTFEGRDVDQLRFRPGQDLMLRIPGPEDRVINRRYTIRGADPSAATVTVDMVVHGDGPGARWAADAAPGQRLDAVGPRGKIWLDETADWHLFVGDETALPGMSIMAESLPPTIPAVIVVELAEHLEGHDLQLAADQQVTVTWIERGDGQPGEPARLVAAVERVPFPSGWGHAYVAGEMKVVRSVTAILAARGLEGSAVDSKAYWRRGDANAPHGEPLDPDRARPERRR
jgi:NADPH-dependent ferric siderophore reductase